MPHRYILYTDNQGRCPVQEYLDSVQEQDLVAIRQRMEALARGIQPLERPYAARLEGRIWEARKKVKKINHRLLFARLSNGDFLYLIGIAKQQAQVPKADIDRASEWLTRWERRHPQR
jgi:phage-related protein